MITNKIIYHMLQAEWWMHSASNGHCQTQEMFHGFGDVEFTPEEKRDDAMEISKGHMHLISELIDVEECKASEEALKQIIERQK